MWEIVIVSSITITVIISIVILIGTFISGRKFRQQQERISSLIGELAPNQKVIFAGGLVGTILSIEDNFVNIQINDNNVVRATVFSVSNIIK